MIYQSINQAVFARVPLGTRSVLDIGCGGGVFGAALKQAHRCEVVGVTHSAAEAAVARQLLDRVEVVDLNNADLGALGRHDCVVCSHVLEHLIDPQQVLMSLQACLEPGGTLIVALPNALFWKQRWQFLRGRFRYTNGGLMDRTHLRFFDWTTAASLLQGAGYRVTLSAADGVFPLASRFGTTLGRSISRVALARWPGVFGVQFVLSARPIA
ncbi:MAG: class I SAM-dependent methyltransferase [Leptothrix sp. (in: b-proteobacteria)]